MFANHVMSYMSCDFITGAGAELKIDWAMEKISF